LSNEKKSYYRKQDAVLSFLDRGLLAHYAELYEESSSLLEDGERAIEAAYTKSITAAISSYLVNDTVTEYAGEDYEDMYINTFNALNYYHRGKIEDAMVEIRRMNNKAQFLASKYGTIISELQKKALEETGSIPANPAGESRFSDSVLARYMGVLFHRGAGQYDDARIDHDQMKLAYANAPGVYTYPLPKSVDGELDVPGGMARLNVLAFSGLSPVKIQETMRIPLLTNGTYIKIALPQMTSRLSRVSSIVLDFDDGRRIQLELLEDMGGVARETFKNKQGVSYAKSIIRASMKGLTSAALDVASEETEGTTALIMSIFSFGNKIFSEASEQADLRISRYFPDKAWVGAVNLEPGIYSFTVNYLDSGGNVIASFPAENIAVAENKLNLTEAVCLK
jgi:hypothetical protein